MKISRLLLLFALVAIIQLATPVYMAWKWEDILQNGQRFSWQTAPVDPYDPFKGRYIDLNFKNTSGPLLGQDSMEYGRSAYAAIAEDSAGKAYISGVGASQPADKAFVRVKINYVEHNTVHVSLPFKRYYLPERMAPAAETAYRRHTNESGIATVRIKDGFAVIEQLYLNGKTLEEYLTNQ